MKLCCHKCQTIITKDLRPVKIKWDGDYISNLCDVFHRELSKYYDPEDNPVEEYEYTNMKSGIFYMTPYKHYNWTERESGIRGYYKVITEKPQIVVSGDSILADVIPPNPKNCCCNWSYEPLPCPECGLHLGTMHLDCYEDNSVRFDIDKVVRLYK